MELKRIDPLSAGKIAGVLYAGIALVVGGIIGLFAVLGLFAAPVGNGSSGAFLFAALVVCGAPIVYGVLAFCLVTLMAALYNVVAKVVGGIEVELEGPGRA